MAKLCHHYTTEQGLFGIVRSQALHAIDFIALKDKTEFVYTLSAIFEEVITQMLPQIPEDIRDKIKGVEHIHSLIPKYINALRKHVEESDGYGSLYVTSFARGKNENEDEIGIPHLWQNYAKNDGFCLQFSRERINRLITHEKERHSYSCIDLVEVKYGIDRQSSDFKYLVAQMSLQTQKYLLLVTNDLRLETDFRKIHPDSYFLRKLFIFCGQHKDPAFAEEREVRIFACPENVCIPQFLTGVSLPKKIHKQKNGTRYIYLGKTVLPGVIPYRILMGPNAELPMWKREALYPHQPQIYKDGKLLR